MKQVVVTGGSGLIGQRLCTLLEGESKFVDLSLASGVNILEKTQLEKKFSELGTVDLVIHLAAFTNVSQAEDQKGDVEGDCYQINVTGTQNLVEVCHQNQMGMVYISTDYVFAGDKDEKYTEADEPKPINWYGKTKLAGEQLVYNLQNGAIMRIGYPYGYGFVAKKDWLHSFIARMKDNPKAAFFEDQIITPIFIDDVVLAIKAYLNNPKSGLWHVYGDESFSPYELAEMINTQFMLGAVPQANSLQTYVSNTPDKANLYPPRLKMDNHKFKLDFEWQPQKLEHTLQVIAQSEAYA